MAFSFKIFDNIICSYVIGHVRSYVCMTSLLPHIRARQRVTSVRGLLMIARVRSVCRDEHNFTFAIWQFASFQLLFQSGNT